MRRRKGETPKQYWQRVAEARRVAAILRHKRTRKAIEDRAQRNYKLRAGEKAGKFFGENYGALNAEVGEAANTLAAVLLMAGMVSTTWGAAFATLGGNADVLLDSQVDPEDPESPTGAELVEESGMPGIGELINPVDLGLEADAWDGLTPSEIEAECLEIVSLGTPLNVGDVVVATIAVQEEALAGISSRFQLGTEWAKVRRWTESAGRFQR